MTLLAKLNRLSTYQIIMSEALNLATNPNTSPKKLIALLSENGRDDAIVSAIAKSIVHQKNY